MFKNYKFKAWHGIALGVAAYIGLNLSSDFRDAKDATFDSIKDSTCEISSLDCETQDASPNP